ncbi:hypothetical protein RIF29_25470 [Crotalaria pallida]|uniref:Uncharacterized protein n=1 Tax=Crotalaria pallida TaxID=3830 RepID=A0AAN9I148_CROPI
MGFFYFFSLSISSSTPHISSSCVLLLHCLQLHKIEPWHPLLLLQAVVFIEGFVTTEENPNAHYFKWDDEDANEASQRQIPSEHDEAAH